MNLGGPHLGCVVQAAFVKCPKHGRVLPTYKYIYIYTYIHIHKECEFKRAYNVYRSALNSLADRAITRREARYHIRPRLHFLGRLVYHYLPRNPRHYMNFADEDFVASTKKIAESSPYVLIDTDAVYLGFVDSLAKLPWDQSSEGVNEAI